MRKVIVGVIVFAVLVIAGTFVYRQFFGGKPKPVETSASQIDHPTPKDQNTVKKGLRRFRFESEDGSIVSDGSMTLKENLTSAGIRLINAPTLPAGEHYEVYLVFLGQSPVYIAQLKEVNTRSQKYLWGGAGPVDWYKADKILVTKRTENGQRPGSKVLEAKIGQEESANPR